MTPKVVIAQIVKANAFSAQGLVRTVYGIVLSEPAIGLVSDLWGRHRLLSDYPTREARRVHKQRSGRC